MPRNANNRRRAFADVVTIDAWHDAFDSKHSAVDLHADVVFGMARVGGEIELPVRFRLSVKRAEVVVIIPNSEPVSVDKKSVSRDSPALQGQLTEVLDNSTRVEAKGGISATASPTKFGASTTAEARARASRSTNKKLKISATVQMIVVTQSQNADGHYRWVIEPRTSKTLEGHPWDANKQPRLRLIDERKDRSRGIPPTVRVEVCCRREDLSIDDLVIKDRGVWNKVRRGLSFKNKVAAAESYIRDRLTEEGLEVRNIEDIFGQMTLGSVTAEAI